MNQSLSAEGLGYEGVDRCIYCMLLYDDDRSITIDWSIEGIYDRLIDWLSDVSIDPSINQLYSMEVDQVTDPLQEVIDWFIDVSVDWPSPGSVWPCPAGLSVVCPGVSATAPAQTRCTQTLHCPSAPNSKQRRPRSWQEVTVDVFNKYTTIPFYQVGRIQESEGILNSVYIYTYIY